MSASLGPTFRYIRAITIMTITITRTRSPAITTTSFGNPNIHSSFHRPPPKPVSKDRGSPNSRRELDPALHVSDALFIARDDDFGSFIDRLAIFGTSACTAPQAVERKDDFSGAAFANRHAQGSDCAFKAAFVAAHGLVASGDKLDHESKHAPSGSQTGRSRKHENHKSHQSLVPGEQVACSSEPGEEGHRRGSVKPGHVRSAPVGRRSSVLPQMKRQTQLEGQVNEIGRASCRERV